MVIDGKALVSMATKRLEIELAVAEASPEAAAVVVMEAKESC